MKNGAMTFAANLRKLRIAAGLSQERLAHACGYPGQSRIGNYENEGPSGREPKLAEIPVIARALGVEIAALFGEPPSGQGSQATRLDPERITELATVLCERAGIKPEERLRWDLRKEGSAENFVEAYEAYAAMKEKPTPANIVRFSEAIANSPQGARKDERGSDVPAKGTTKRNVGRSGSHKA